MNVLWRALLTGGVALVSLQVAIGDSVEVVKLEDQPWYEAEDKAVAREIISPRNSSVEWMRPTIM
ncbi:MAG: hypothetical protein AAFV47_05855 [Pseudomonadota bacterium]